MIFLALLPARQENHGNNFSHVILLSIVMLVLEVEKILRRCLSNSQRLAIRKRLQQETVPLQIDHLFKIKPMNSQQIRAYLIMKVLKIFVGKSRLWCVPFMEDQLEQGALKRRLSSFTYRTPRTINSCLQNLQAILRLLAKLLGNQKKQEIY